MGEQIREAAITDPELDPEVAGRRNSLFEKYVSPYLNMVYKLCINYTYNPANVEENYTEVLVNFYRRIETYNPDRPILTWLENIKLKILKCEVPACQKRTPPTGF